MKVSKYNFWILIFLLLVSIVLSSMSFYFVFADRNLLGYQNRFLSSTDDTVVVHISSGASNPHSILMGLKTAETFADLGKKVIVYFDVKGVYASVKSNNIKFADFPPSQEVIANLISKGVIIQVCKHCLMLEGYTDKDVKMVYLFLINLSLPILQMGG